MEVITSKFYKSEHNFTGISHEKGSIPLILDILDMHSAELIVELGTFRGGMTMLMHEHNTVTPLYTYDIKSMKDHWRRTPESYEHFKENVFNLNVFFRVENVLLGLFEIRSLLLMPVRKLLYCDNGNKRQEFVMYSKFLQRGDIIGVHDVGIEIHLTSKDVKYALENFKPHPYNKKFEEIKATSRFFIKQ